MARTYTLHVARDALPGEPEALDRAELVRDGFSWGAFVFSAFWFFWHRAWLVGFLLLIAQISFGGALRLLGVHPGASMLALLLVNGLIGLEAASLRRWALARRGRPAVDVVSAADAEEAETKSFTRFLAAESMPLERARSMPWTGGHRQSDPVIGLFPDAERAR